MTGDPAGIRLLEGTTYLDPFPAYAWLRQHSPVHWDEEGAVWVALYGGGRVARYLPDGTLDRMLEVPARRVASLCFGGADRRDLYVATGDNANDRSLRGSIFKTRVDVAGLPTPMARV